jgi:hypothetical protein
MSSMVRDVTALKTRFRANLLTVLEYVTGPEAPAPACNSRGLIWPSSRECQVAVTHLAKAVISIGRALEPVPGVHRPLLDTDPV